MRNKLLVGALALAMTCTTVFSSVAPATVKAASVSTVQTQAATNSDEYVYCYAGLTWAEYWKSEEVYLNGSNWSASSKTKDNREDGDEYDKGAFDAVTRATSTHGPHRASFQSIMNVYDADGNVYSVSHWDANKVAYLSKKTNGKSSFTFGKNDAGDVTLVFDDNTVAVYGHLEMAGSKYVPVAVKKSDFAEFSKKYDVVEKDGALTGGYAEKSLKAFSATANVTANTNGLKVATKQSDGTFTFSARQTGTESGLANEDLKDAPEGMNVVQRTTESSGTFAVGHYGDFIRVDLTGDYGTYAAHLQTAKWTYYGDDSTYSKPLRTYGTKLAADDWMHSSQGIQLGLTDSYRCHLPKGTDGTGYWRVTVYALGYKDFTFDIQATADNICTANLDTISTTDLEAAIKNAQSYKSQKANYTTASWSNFESALATAEATLEDPADQDAVTEAITNLQNAIKALAKKPAATTTQKKNNTTPAKPALKKANVKLSKPALKVGKTTKNKAKVTWKKINKATGYEIQYTTKVFGNKKATKTVKISKAKTTSAQLKKLTKKTKYKVRIRAVYSKAGYQTVTSKWSATKTVKTK